jgi:major vault protein
VRSKIIKPNCALKLQAQRSLVDAEGVSRHAGEQWLLRNEGSYLPRLYEQVVEIVKGIVITHKEALKVRATKSFKDIYNIGRQAGEEWLVTNDMTQMHILDVYEESVKKVYATTLSNR